MRCGSEEFYQEPKLEKKKGTCPYTPGLQVVSNLKRNTLDAEFVAFWGDIYLPITRNCRLDDAKNWSLSENPYVGRSPGPYTKYFRETIQPPDGLRDRPTVFG